MPSQTFYLLGESQSTAKEIEIDSSENIDGLQHILAAHFAIVEPNGSWFLLVKRLSI